MEFIKFSDGYLRTLNLFVLREIGRVIGVKAPASMNKTQLIHDIIGIQNGDIEPVEQAKVGAPPKNKIDLTEFYAIPKDAPYGYKAKPMTGIVFNDIEDENGSITSGILDIHPNGYGFLRVHNYGNSKDDIYVSAQNVKKYRLRRGDNVNCMVTPSKEDEARALKEVISVNGFSVDSIDMRKVFDDLVPCYPSERMRLEAGDFSGDVTLRCIDLFAPLGLGQRGLIVAPPKTGKTTILKKIASSFEKNYPYIKLIVLLIDERPEEVTDFKSSIESEVVSSTFDESAEHHVKTAELVINRAKRLVECGEDVVLLLDSITRLTRAYNNVVESTGKTLSGGIDPAAFSAPKRFFGAARNVKDGGSLTILSTALIDTGSRMDDVIYEEFKGTGNMEIHLSRDLAEKRVFPAIDLFKSGTRKEELLLPERELTTVYRLRKMLSERDNSTESLLDTMAKSKKLNDFIAKAEAWFKLYGDS